MSCLQEQFPPAEEERKTTERAEESRFKAVVCYATFYPVLFLLKLLGTIL